MIRVLIVDDHSVVRLGIQKIINFEKDMVSVGESETGEDVLDLINEKKPDVVLMDINLPTKNGINITSEIKKLHPTCRVLILTMYEHSEYFLAALDAGTDGYLLKDSSPEKITEAIRVIHEGHSIIPPSLTKNLIKQKRGAIETEEDLTPREREVLSSLVRGLSNKEIAQELFISERTVKIHINKIFKKMNVKSRSQAIINAVKNKMISLT
ncbi:response regulator [Heyndrickxia sporothermodurans]